MVKADAYGHGVKEVATALAGAGTSSFGVATLEEAAELAGVVAGARIIVFGGLLPSDAAAVVDLGVEVASDNGEAVAAIGAAASSAGRRVPIHIKVDTGMRRFGVEAGEAADFVARVAATEGVIATALWSHLAAAELPQGRVTDQQLKCFIAAADAVFARRISSAAGCISRENLSLHLANSAAVIGRPDSHLDLVRPGLMLYGLYPDAACAPGSDDGADGAAAPAVSMRALVKLEPVMSFEAPLLRIAELGPGQGIGYGHSYRTSAATRVATLRCGYADGYPRSLSNRGYVVIAGRRAPVVGRVCMDHTLVDVSAVEAVAVGDRAVLWGRDPSADEVAARADTISYELVARVGPRVERVYK